MCVCAYVGAWVRGCAPHLANISKIVQDATRAGTQAPERQRESRRGAGTPAKQNLLLMGDLNGNNEKKLKKICELRKKPYLCNINQKHKAI